MDYTIVPFSDSQKLINLGGIYAKGNTNVEESVQIISRMSWNDLQLIICATEALREAGVKHIHLYVPYFLGARSDRKFQAGSVNYLKQVICPIINSLNFDSVTVLDPHSNCLEMGLEIFRKLSSIDLLSYAIEDLYKLNATSKEDFLEFFKTSSLRNSFAIIGPDKGSFDRVTEAAKALGTKNVVICDKHRDILTGKILSIDVGNLVDLQGQDVFVLDDICDGGGTFNMLADKLRLLNPGKMYLVVTHGIFSAGYNVLLDKFDGIYCTNSVHNIVDNGIWAEMCPYKKLSRIKQLQIL